MRSSTCIGPVRPSSLESEDAEGASASEAFPWRRRRGDHQVWVRGVRIPPKVRVLRRLSFCVAPSLLAEHHQLLDVSNGAAVLERWDAVKAEPQGSPASPQPRCCDRRCPRPAANSPGDERYLRLL